MMKNYYKILGVKKDASEEEIREHWVELMRKLHPDQRIEGTAEDERIKEINEAYQVLKHSSTRVEYDLKRAYDQRKRNSYLRRLSIPIAIFVVLVMIGTIYLKKPQVTLQSVLLPKNPINQTNEIDDPNDLNELNVPNQIDPTNQINPTNVIDSMAILPNDPMTQKRIKLSTKRRNDATMPKLDEASKPTTQLPNDSITQLPNDPIAPTPQRNVQTVFNDTNDPNDPNVPHMAVSTKKPNDPIDPPTQQPKRSNVPNDPNDRNVLNVPLIATEEEVRRFFTNYTEKYTQKDLDSFISLFSSRAVQNRKDGLEGIRKIYGNFLNQSQEIKYHMENISIEIYQNGIEVKARYELVQMMKKSGDKRIWRGDIRWSLIKEDGALKILSLDYQHQKSP